MDNNAKLRPLYIAKILHELTDEEHYLSTNQISEILEKEYGMTSHRQTIKADIELLIQFGLDIQETRSTQNKYNLLGRDFEISELKLLIDAVLSSKFISKEHSLNLVDKISSLAGKHAASTLKRNVSCEGRIKAENKKIHFIIDRINEAINENKKISFQYFQYDTDKTHKLRNNGMKYEITPLHLVWNGDYYYMIGVYDYKQKMGSFRIDRIAHIPDILEEEGISPPNNFNLNDYVNSTFRMFNSKREEVILECDNNVMDSIIDRFGESVEVIERKEHTFSIKASITLNSILYSWVFGFGGKVQIKSPSYAIMAYENMLADALEHFKKENESVF